MAKLQPTLAKICQFWSSRAKCLAKLGQFGPQFCESWSKLVNPWHFVLIFANIGRFGPHLAIFRSFSDPVFRRSWAKSRPLGHPFDNFGATVGQPQSSPGCAESNFSATSTQCSDLCHNRLQQGPRRRNSWAASAPKLRCRWNSKQIPDIQNFPKWLRLTAVSDQVGSPSAH